MSRVFVSLVVLGLVFASGASCIDTTSLPLQTVVLPPSNVLGTFIRYDDPRFPPWAAFDGDLSTYYDSTPNPGTDLTANLNKTVTIVAINVAAAADACCTDRILGAVFEAADDPEFTVNKRRILTIDTLPATNAFTTFPLSAPVSTQFVRLRSGTWYGNVAEIQFIGYNQSLSSLVPGAAVLSSYTRTDWGYWSPANAFDGLFDTYYDSNPYSSSFVGLDFGVNKTVIALQVAARADPCCTNRIVGAVFEIAADVNFTIGVVPIYTITTTPAINNYTTIILPSPVFTRYIRLRSETWYGNVADIVFLGFNSTNIDPAPVPTTTVSCVGGDVEGHMGKPMVRADGRGSVYAACSGNLPENSIIRYHGVTNRTGTLHLTAHTTDIISYAGVGQCDTASGVAVDGAGNVYAACFNNDKSRSIIRYPVYQPLLAQFITQSSSSANCVHPRGLILDNANPPNVIVACAAYEDSALHASIIVSYAQAGSGWSATWTPTIINKFVQCADITGLAVDSANNIYASCSGNDASLTLLRFSPSGGNVTVVTAAGNCGMPSFLAVDSSTTPAHVIASCGSATGDVSIVKYVADGSAMAVVSRADGGRCDWATGVAADAKGNIYAACSNNDPTQSVRVYTPAGAVVDYSSANQTSCYRPTFLSLDRFNNLYAFCISNQDADTLVAYSPNFNSSTPTLPPTLPPTAPPTAPPAPNGTNNTNSTVTEYVLFYHELPEDLDYETARDSFRKQLRAALSTSFNLDKKHIAIVKISKVASDLPFLFLYQVVVAFADISTASHAYGLIHSMAVVSPGDVGQGGLLNPSDDLAQLLRQCPDGSYASTDSTGDACQQNDEAAAAAAAVSLHDTLSVGALVGVIVAAFVVGAGVGVGIAIQKQRQGNSQEMTKHTTQPMLQQGERSVSISHNSTASATSQV